MSSTNFQIDWDSISHGGLDTSSSSSYNLRDSFGNIGSGIVTSSSYNLQVGYRAGLYDRLLMMDIQTISENTQMNVLSLSGETIEVDTTTNVSIGDLLVVVANRGASEVDAIGVVVSKTTTSITVDALQNAGTSPVIDGVNDYAYVLDGNTASFGTLSSSEVKTTIIGWNVTADLKNGYTVSVLQDGELRSDSASITPVSDGLVTAGSEEYGARSSDTTLSLSTFDIQDTAITSQYQPVATESGVKFQSRNFLVLKTSISPSTTAGTYNQQLTFMVASNF